MKKNRLEASQTTLSPPDEQAATTAVNYVVPQWSNTYNPGHNADVEVALTAGDDAQSGLD